jgi:choline monooxygenase
MTRRLDIDPDIRRARTLPSAVYRDSWWWERQRERLFPRTWHLFPHIDSPREPGDIKPWSLLPRCLDEPLLLTRDEGGAMHCMSNVCTHRANILVDRPCNARGIRCGYHGRRFGLDGRMHSMPEFEEAEDFPSRTDDLPRAALERWHSFWFASLQPEHAIDTLLGPMSERLDWLPWHDLQPMPSACREYHVAANWALYCDNYLEGFHIPFVHPSLARALDYASYRTELLPLGVLQIGVAQAREHAFEPPPSHPDYGQRIAGYYYWLFPCTMFNIYPWGVSINAVLPLGPEHCKVVYLTWVWDPSKHDTGAGSGLDEVEHEDEAVVEACAQGIRSRLYDRGRYSPSRERGVHHFHRLLARFLEA